MMTNFIGLFNKKNMLGEELFKALSLMEETTMIATASNAIDPDFREKIKISQNDNGVFVFNSSFINELDEISLEYSERICAELSTLFKTIKELSIIFMQAGAKAKFIFITTNPSISSMSRFPISPIYDEAAHSLIRSLAKELKPFNLSFFGICTEPIFEFISKEELRNYRKSMKIYALKKIPVKIKEFVSLIKNIALTDFSLASGNVFYIGEGLDPMNF
jgi:hypothetical protein